MAFTEDLTAFFSTGEFAESVTFEGSIIDVLMGVSNIDADPEHTQMLVETKECIARSADVGTIVVGQDVTIDAEVWRVLSSEDQKSGVVRLTISRIVS
jgi:hypothetical protein